MKIIQSKNIRNYKPILEGLVKDFGYIYYHAILAWCDIITNNKDGRFWEVYLIKEGKDIIGICGLYSLHKKNNNDLWLGWFGILPEYRNQGYGEKALDWMKNKAKELGAINLMSYVDAEGKPLKFYFRNGFEEICDVSDYLLHYAPDGITIDDFEAYEDRIIKHEL